MSKKYETIDEQLDKKFEKKSAKKEKRGAIIRIVAAFIAFVLTTAFALQIITRRRRKENVNLKSDTAITATVDDTKDKNNDKEKLSIKNLGKKLELPSKEDSEKARYGQTTGDVDSTKVVELDGTIWKNQEAADNSNKVGTVVINTNQVTLDDGTVEQKDLTIDENGKVKVQEEGHEVVDNNGNTVESGDNGIPDGYVWDDVLQGYVPQSEAGKYVNCDKDYWGYDENGKAYIVLHKDEVILKSRLDEAKATLYTTRPDDIVIVNNNPNPTDPEPVDTEAIEETVSNEGVLNEDETYKIYGFETKEDYEQWVIQGYEGYALIDGIMRPETAEIINETQKVK